ncbi:TIGR02452 family protein [Actinoplanes sp. NPDC049668]|uniref:TIGR02452 family protein n=1 Tax=unclassified Actinoplanes TaxID=2626549 RepID=UPI0033B58F27
MSTRLRAIARETVAAAESGRYRGPDGEQVRVDVGPAVAGTRLYLPEDELPGVRESGGTAARIEVTGESTLVAARRIGGDVAALVFASARNPGGGFLNGAQAQEESLARSSGLYPCLRAAGDFYAHHRAQTELTYTDRVIYSPGVPVFRDDKGGWLTQAYPVTFLTSAAPNLAAIRRGQPHLAAEVPAILRRRAARVLAVAAAHGHRRLVLGAWGCGVFGNDPAVVAGAFAAALERQPMDEVVFAVLGPNRAAFEAVFASAAR